MRKLHVVLIAALLALTAVLGMLAASRTVSLGAATRQSNVTAVQARAGSLDAYAASLRRSLSEKPPALPPLPPKATKAAAGPVSPRVIYRRPPPIVVVRHTHHGDDEHEAGGGVQDD